MSIMDTIRRKIESPEKKKIRIEEKKREERKKLSENPCYFFINNSMLDNTRLSLGWITLGELRKNVDEDIKNFIRNTEIKLNKDRDNNTSNVKQETKTVYYALKNISGEEIDAMFSRILRLNFSGKNEARYRIDPAGTKVSYNPDGDSAEYTERRMKEIKEKQEKKARSAVEKIKNRIKANPRKLFSKEDLQREMEIFENWFDIALQKVAETYQQEGTQKILVDNKYYFCYNDLLPKTEKYLKEHPSSFFLSPDLFKILCLKTREDKFFFKEAVKELVSSRKTEGFLLKTYSDKFQKWEIGYSDLADRIIKLVEKDPKTERQIRQELEIKTGDPNDQYLKIVLDNLINKRVITKFNEEKEEQIILN